MQQIKTPRGLCSTCSKSAYCTYPRNPELPVWHCDEFEEEATAMMAATPVRNRQVQPVKNNPGRHDDGEAGPPGLCRLCAKRFDCTFPKSAGGVWHCEEYE